jgi:hypothetical protein
MGTLGLIDPANEGEWPPVVEGQGPPNVRPFALWDEARRCSPGTLIYKLIVGFSMEGFGPLFSMEEACSKT